jgi:hypothetical protein
VDIVSAFARAGATTLATDLDPLAPALWHADHQAIAPRIDDPGYIDFLHRLVDEHDVRLIVPLTDLDHVKLVRARDELGALVLLPVRGGRAPRRRQVHRASLLRGARDPVAAELAARRRAGRRALSAAREGARGLRLAQHLPRSGPGELDFFLRYTPVDSFVQTCCRARSSRSTSSATSTAAA